MPPSGGFSPHSTYSSRSEPGPKGPLGETLGEAECLGEAQWARRSLAVGASGAKPPHKPSAWVKRSLTNSPKGCFGEAKCGAKPPIFKFYDKLLNFKSIRSKITEKIFQENEKKEIHNNDEYFIHFPASVKNGFTILMISYIFSIFYNFLNLYQIFLLKIIFFQNSIHFY